MVLKLIHSTPFLRKLYFTKWGKRWVQKKTAPFITWLSPNSNILDVGSGGGLVAYTLREQGFQITPLDIDDLSYAPEVKPVVYDGETMPFNDLHFDTALLLTVLHHIEEPEKVLQETCRVARQVIIIEDIYNTPLQKWLTFRMDSFVNWAYAPCPHTNKNDAAWKKTFEEMGMQLKAVHYRKVLGYFRQGIYCIEHK